MSLDGFVPLALQPGWVLEREFDWCVLEQTQALKVLTRRRGPWRACLVLTRGLLPADADALLIRHRALGPLTLATWVDLGAPDAAAPATLVLAGRVFARAERGLFFGAGTFVVDLRDDPDALWARVSAGKRKEARHVERLGARVTCQTAQADDVRDYLKLHDALARRKPVGAAPAGVLARLAERGALLACRARDAQDVTRVLDLLYVDHDQGYFLYGASAHDVPPGLGLLAQWEGLRALRDRGCRFYDQGLVSSTRGDDGVYRFKRALGGTFVAYGAEYRHTPALWRAPLALREHLRAGG